MPQRWSIVTPFKVKNHRAFVDAAEEAGLWQLFKRNQAGYTFGLEERVDEDGKQLEALYQVLQQHLVPREYVLLRIVQWSEQDDPDDRRGARARVSEHTRYEKVYPDRVEPTVYSDDPSRRR